MAISNKPLLWLPFAAGGMLAALLAPALMLLILGDSLHWLPAGLNYERVHAFVAHPLVRIALFGFVVLLIWHAAHRLRMTLQDLGVRGAAARRLSARLCYGAATLLSLALIGALLML